MATYRHTHTKQARRAKAHGPSTLIIFNTDALGGGSAGGISNFPVITETRGTYVRVFASARAASRATRCLYYSICRI